MVGRSRFAAFLAGTIQYNLSLGHRALQISDICNFDVCYSNGFPIIKDSLLASNFQIILVMLCLFLAQIVLE